MPSTDHIATQTSLAESAGSAEQNRGRNSLSSDPRIDLATCRTLLGGHCDLTNDEILRLRDVLYDVASIALDSVLESQKARLAE
jgi:hypothetical protein